VTIRRRCPENGWGHSSAGEGLGLQVAVLNGLEYGPRAIAQQVPRTHVSVKPDRWTTPCRTQGYFPHRHDRFGVNLSVQGSNGVSGFCVVDGQMPAAKKVVLPGRRPLRRIDPLEICEELSAAIRGRPESTLQKPRDCHSQVAFGNQQSQGNIA
jgi:hypothetical protein